MEWLASVVFPSTGKQSRLIVFRDASTLGCLDSFPCWHGGRTGIYQVNISDSLGPPQDRKTRNLAQLKHFSYSLPFPLHLFSESTSFYCQALRSCQVSRHPAWFVLSKKPIYCVYRHCKPKIISQVNHILYSLSIIRPIYCCPLSKQSCV